MSENKSWQDDPTTSREKTVEFANQVLAGIHKPVMNKAGVDLYKFNDEYLFAFLERDPFLLVPLINAINDDGATIDSMVLYSFLNENEIPNIAPFTDTILLKINGIKHISSTHAKTVDYPLDKINSKIWGLMESQQNGGQIGIHTERHGTENPVLVYYAINFNDAELAAQGIQITKKLTAYEKRLYIAAGALYKAKSGEAFGLSELYKAMGYEGNPNARDRQRIHTALTKMMTAHIYVNNEQEIKANYKYARFVYDGQLLPGERITAIIDGNLTDSATHLFREPPLISFAQQRKQITTIAVKVLQTPISKTDANLILEDYLIERIATETNKAITARNRADKMLAKGGTDKATILKRREAASKPFRILYESIYKGTKTTESKQQARMKGKIKTLLQHYKECGFIKEFSTDAKGISITDRGQIV